MCSKLETGRALKPFRHFWYQTMHKSGACSLKLWLTTTGVVSKPDIFGHFGNLQNSSDVLSDMLRRPKILKIFSINVFMAFA